MPPVGAFLATSAAFVASNTAAAVGFSVAAQASIAAGAATVGSIVGGLAIPVGLSLAASAFLRPEQPKPSATQREFQQPVPFRDWAYGRVKKSGPLLFYDQRADTPLGASNESLFKIIALQSRELDAIEAHYLNDQEVTLGTGSWGVGNFVQEGPYIVGGVSLVRIIPHLGTDSQTYDTVLGGVFPEWTSNHRLRGIAYVVVECIATGTDKFSAGYPSGEPNYSALIRGAKVYDPRDGDHDPDDKSTWAWSENAGLCTLDWLRHPDGYAIADSLLDMSSFEDHADLCDEEVDLNAGGTEKRYRVATTVSLGERRTDVLARLREASDARLYRGPSGQYGIRGGKWTSPPVSIAMGSGTGMRTIEAEFSDGPDALDRYNELTFRFVSPDHGYTEVEGDPWRDEAAITANDGVVVTRPIDLLQVPSHSQARRLAKIIMARDNPKWIGRIRTDFAGLDLINQENFNLSWPEMNEPEDEFDGPFLVGPGMTLTADFTGMLVPCRSADPDAYEWDEDTEEGEPPPVPDDLVPEE